MADATTTETAAVDPAAAAAAERAASTPVPSNAGEIDVPQQDVAARVADEVVVETTANEIVTIDKGTYHFYPNPDGEVDGTARVTPFDAPQPAESAANRDEEVAESTAAATPTASAAAASPPAASPAAGSSKAS